MLNDASRAELEKELTEEILAAIKRVEAFGPPARETLFDDVYEERPWHLQEEAEDSRKLPEAPSGH